MTANVEIPVYIVTKTIPYGDDYYSDTTIVGVFTDRDGALACIEAQPDYTGIVDAYADGVPFEDGRVYYTYGVPRYRDGRWIGTYDIEEATLNKIVLTNKDSNDAIGLTLCPLCRCEIEDDECCCSEPLCPECGSSGVNGVDKDVWNCYSCNNTYARHYEGYDDYLDLGKD
jgi:hypothetical protein